VHGVELTSSLVPITTATTTIIIPRINPIIKIANSHFFFYYPFSSANSLEYFEGNYSALSVGAYSLT